jgi:hypothetical protein
MPSSSRSTLARLWSHQSRSHSSTITRPLRSPIPWPSRRYG